MSWAIATVKIMLLQIMYKLKTQCFRPFISMLQMFWTIVSKTES
jgi:hypothetical protein